MHSTIPGQFVLMFTAWLAMPVSLAADPSDMFVVRSTNKSIDDVVKAIEVYSDRHDWFFMGADKILGGEITLVKTCIPEVGQMVWPQGRYLSAMLPCGNLSVYIQNGKTEISMLKGRYMHALVPTAAMKKASDALQPLLNDLMKEITK